MWLRLLMQLGDLLPHLSRLIPIMERYATGNRAAGVLELPEGGHALQQLQSSHDELLRHLSSQSVQLDVIEQEMRLLRQSADRSEEHGERMRQQLARLSRWFSIAAGAGLLMLAALLVLAARSVWHLPL